MTTANRLRGLRALIEDAVDQGASAVERVHRATASRPFDVLDHVAPIASITLSKDGTRVAAVGDKVVKVWTGVNPTTHSDDVLGAIAGLNGDQKVEPR